MTTMIPTLSTFGWVTNALEKLDFALAHFFESDKLQTVIYGKNISSFQWIIQRNSNNPYAAAEQVRSVLNTYLLRYYDAAVTSVSVRPEDEKNPGTRTILQLSLTVSQDGVQYDAQRLALLNNGQFMNFINLNNEATA